MADDFAPTDTFYIINNNKSNKPDNLIKNSLMLYLILANYKNGTLPLMIDQSTGLQAHTLRRLIVMLFKLLFNPKFNPEHCSLCRLVTLLYCL